MVMLYGLQEVNIASLSDIKKIDGVANVSFIEG